mgnify:CR=1 FL=1
MNKLLLVSILLLAFSNIVSAEVYTITGYTTFSDDTPVKKTKITVECSVNEYNCTSINDMVTTDLNGKYQIILDINKSYNGKKLSLEILGEYFVHIIELKSQNETQQEAVIQDIQLNQTSPTYPISFSACCVFLIFSIAFVIAIYRTFNRILNPQEEFIIKRTIVICPICNGNLSNHLLIRHLIVEHDVAASDAANISEQAITTKI